MDIGDVEEDIIRHPWLTHIGAGLSISPIAYHAPSHAVDSRKLDEDAHVGQLTQAGIAEAEEAIEDDEVPRLDDFSWLSLGFPGGIIPEIVLRDLHLLSVLERFNMLDEQRGLERFRCIEILESLALEIDVEVFRKSRIRIIVHVIGDSVDAVCSKCFDDLLCEISFA